MKLKWQHFDTVISLKLIFHQHNKKHEEQLLDGASMVEASADWSLAGARQI